MILFSSLGSSTLLPAPAVVTSTAAADLARCDYDQRISVASDAEVALKGQWTTVAAGHGYQMVYRCGAQLTGLDLAVLARVSGFGQVVGSTARKTEAPG